MNPTNAVVLAAVVVVVGKWSKDQRFTIQNFVGFAVMALVLAAMNEGNEKLAKSFAALILVTALLIYAIPISKALGYSR